MKKEPTVDLQCSFCGKHQREVRKLIAGPTVYICDECIGLCNDIIAEEVEREPGDSRVQRQESPSDRPGPIEVGITAVDGAAAVLRKVSQGLPDDLRLISHAIALLDNSAHLLRAELEQWKQREERVRSQAAEVERRRVLERQEAESTQVWGRIREDWERTRATVSDLEASLARLRGALHGTLGGEHRLLLEDVGLKAERLSNSLGPERDGKDTAPTLDRRAWAILVLLAPNLWRITRALREVLRDGARTLGYQELGGLEGVLGDVTSLGEQLGLELRAGWSRWRASELRARFEDMQKTVTAVQKKAPAHLLSPPVHRRLEETLEELRSVTARLAELDAE